MLKSILFISGKPGLYKLISQGKNMIIVEAISAERKRIPVYGHDKITSLADIAIYTDADEVSLKDILNTIKEKENGGTPAIDTKKATNDELRAYFKEILPDFDRDRVYPTDIKKIINWYNILTANGITDFQDDENEETAEQEDQEKE